MTALLSTTGVPAIPACITISAAERDRGNQAILDLDAARVTIIARDATIAQLRAQLAATAAPTRNGLYVDGATLRTKNGTAVSIRGIECMWGPTCAGNPTAAMAAMKSFGANTVSPLFQQGQSSAAHVVACLAAARAAGLLVGVNADHTDDGRAWIKRADIVAACNAEPHVFLECEVEQGDDSTKAQWQAAAIEFVQELRAAGHKAPIKVGSPLGGRSPRYALDAGAAVVAADPLHSVIFTWQAYWKTVSTGWQFSEDNGFTGRGTAGALECADALKASGLCWLVGLDGADDIGSTPYQELAARLHQHAIGWQWWAMMVGDSYGNGLVSDPLSSSPKTPFGATVKVLLQAQATPVVL